MLRSAGMPSSEKYNSEGWAVPSLVFGTLCVFFGIAAISLIRKHPVNSGAAVAIYVAFCLLLALCAMPAFAAPKLWTARQIRRFGPAAVILPVFMAPYLIYALGTKDFRWLPVAKLVGIVLVPVGIYVRFPVRSLERLTWQDAAVWLWWTVPTVLRLTSGIWRVPVNLDFMTRLVIIAIASWLWIFLRPIPDLGYAPKMNFLILRSVASNVVLFAAVTLPIGLITGFVTFNPRWKGLWPFAFDYVTILLFIALLEELFFRGALLRLLGPTVGSGLYARAASSLLFGLSHIFYAPAPNWEYVFLAGIAGWFYGRAYQQTQNLTAPAAAHALVDTLWRTWFGRGAGSLLG